MLTLPYQPVCVLLVQQEEASSSQSLASRPLSHDHPETLLAIASMLAPRPQLDLREFSGGGEGAVAMVINPACWFPSLCQCVLISVPDHISFSPETETHTHTHQSPCSPVTASGKANAVSNTCPRRLVCGSNKHLEGAGWTRCWSWDVIRNQHQITCERGHQQMLRQDGRHLWMFSSASSTCWRPAEGPAHRCLLFIK